MLGKIDNSTGLEIKILQLYQQCRTEAEIQASFDRLQAELEADIAEKLQKVKREVLENFDEDVHKLLKIDYDDALHLLDEVGLKFWALTKVILRHQAEFDEDKLSFRLNSSPFPEAETGEYYLKPKTDMRKKASEFDSSPDGSRIYRMNSPLGEWCIQQAKALDVPCQEVEFDLTGYPARISVLEQLKGQSGYLLLNLLSVESLDKEEYLLFSGFTDQKKSLPSEVLAQFFKLDGRVGAMHYITQEEDGRLQRDMQLLSESTLHRSMETNNRFFKERQEQLERWVDDQIAAAERELKQVQQELKNARRATDLAPNQTELVEAMERVDALNRKKQKVRQKIDDVEEAAEAKRKTIITALKRKLVQSVTNTPLFTIRWKIV